MKYNEVSMKASHNSYQRNETIIEQITWNFAKNYNCGCGGLELDISQSDDGKNWSVDHKNSYDRHYRQLSQFLSDLMVWSKENPNHEVITLHLDLKHTVTDDFPDKLDGYIEDRFISDSIYTPGDLMGGSSTLSKGAKDNGWPRLDELKGKFIICLTGNSDDKKTYAEKSPRNRLCFADKDTKVNEMPSSTHRVFFNFHIYHSKRAEWMRIFKQCTAKSNVIVRAYIANSKESWDDCLSSGCNLIATNKISNHDWAKVGDERFVKLK